MFTIDHMVCLAALAPAARVFGILTLLATGAAIAGALLLVSLIRSARRPPRRTAGWAVVRGYPCDPDDVGRQFESWTIRATGGATLPVWDLPGDEPRGPTAVLLHGWGHSRIHMLDAAEPWLACCARVVLFDRRGHGDTEEGATPLGWEEDDDVAAIVERLGDDRIVLAGHSMGAVTALRAAVLPEVASRLAGVVAIAPYVEFEASFRGRLRTSGLPEWCTPMLMAWFRLIGLRFPDPLEAVRQLQAPLLVVHGADDAMVAPEHAERIVAAARGAELHVLPGVGHSDILRAAGLAPRVDAFLQRAAGLTDPASSSPTDPAVR